jgi:hypothetical protein
MVEAIEADPHVVFRIIVLAARENSSIVAPSCARSIPNPNAQPLRAPANVHVESRGGHDR